MKIWKEEQHMDCCFEEDSVMKIPGQWDMIRAFGVFSRHDGEPFEGELCIVIV